MLLHAVVSRLVFHGAFVIAAVFARAGFVANRDYPMPGIDQVWRDLIRSAKEYGDWDWYKGVADRGYDALPFGDAFQQNWAFFPGFPLIVRLFGHNGMAFIVSQAAFLLSVWLLHDVMSRVSSRRLARGALMLMVYFPASYTVSQYRPETFLLLLTAAALWFAQRGRRWDAAIAGGAAGLLKPNAFLMSLLLLRDVPGLPGADPRRWWQEAWALLRARPWSSAAMLAAPLGGAVLLSAHLGALTGEPLAWARIQKAWGADGGAAVRQAAELLTRPLLVGRGGWDFTLLNWTALALALAGAAALSAHRLRGWALYVLAYSAMTVANFGVFVLSKHLSSCFPMFLGLAFLLRGRERVSLLAFAFAGGLAMCGVFNGMALDFTRP